MVDVSVVLTWKLIAAPLQAVHLAIINEVMNATIFFYGTWHGGFGCTWWPTQVTLKHIEGREERKTSNAAEHFDFVHIYFHSNNRQVKLKCMEKTILTFDHVCLLADFSSH